jgi:hypothetical protein
MAKSRFFPAKIEKIEKQFGGAPYAHAPQKF